VQGELESGLAKITQQQVRVIGAGRTDSGVHALGQVVAFHAQWRHSGADLFRAWNAVLPRDVSVWSLTEAEEGFHPRFDATSRSYRYTIWHNLVRNPLLRRTALWVSQSLDLEAMEAASHLLVGEHDFGTFGSPPQGTNTVRRVVRAEWTRKAEMLYLDIEANAFLYRMVRAIVGTLLQVGTGELSVDQFASAFTAAERSRSGPTAPANGLCLMTVRYQGVPQ
jgi:tRNA pseudouridine38-40 synthase